MLVRTFVHQMKGVAFFHEAVVAPFIFIEKSIQWALILFHAETICCPDYLIRGHPLSKFTLSEG